MNNRNIYCSFWNTTSVILLHHKQSFTSGFDHSYPIPKSATNELDIFIWKLTKRRFEHFESYDTLDVRWFWNSYFKVSIKLFQDRVTIGKSCSFAGRSCWMEVNIWIWSSDRGSLITTEINIPFIFKNLPFKSKPISPIPTTYGWLNARYMINSIL